MVSNRENIDFSYLDQGAPRPPSPVNAGRDNHGLLFWKFYFCLFSGMEAGYVRGISFAL